MAFVVEDGNGLPNANAYADLAFVSTWMEDRGYSDLWDARDDQEALIITATDYIDATYDFHGYRKERGGFAGDQRLAWPRFGYYIRDGEDIPIQGNVVPDRIKEATALAAYYAMTEALFAKQERAVQSESSSVGPLSKSVTYEAGADDRVTFPLLDRLLKDLVRSTADGDQVNLIRA